MDGAGNVYVADISNHLIRKITPAGVVTTLFNGSGGELNLPNGVAVDNMGTLNVADSDNNAIKKISSTGEITLFAGSGNSLDFGFTDGTGSAARFTGPTGVAVDGSGNVYVADYNNQVIRKISPSGVVTTVAGNTGGSGSGNGTGVAVAFSGPYGVAVDCLGNLYVADMMNNTIRKGVYLPLPSITKHPVSQGFLIGSSVTLTAVATGTPIPTYQWQKGGLNIAGATSGTHTIASAVMDDAGSYRVAVTNSFGTVTSYPATLALIVAPSAAIIAITVE